MEDDIEELQNMISDVKSWKEERKEIEKELTKLEDRIEGLDDDISTTLAAIQDFINQLTDID